MKWQQRTVHYLALHQITEVTGKILLFLFFLLQMPLNILLLIYSSSRIILEAPRRL